MSCRYRRVLLALILPLLVLPFLQSCTPAAKAEIDTVPRAAAEERIVIFHLNDVHGKIDNLAKVADIVANERRSGAEVLFVSAGDNFTGNPVIDQFDPPGEPILQLYNHLGLNLMCIGNHEFDYGFDGLCRFAAQAKFPMLSANIDVPAGRFPQLKPSLVLTTAQGTRIAVFGLIQIEPGLDIPATHPDKVKGLRFGDPLVKAREFKSLRQGNQILLALTHIGYDQDLKLAEQMPELDLIIGGHSHTRVNPAETVNGVLIAQAGSDIRHLGRVELLLRNGRLVEKKGGLIDVRTHQGESAEVRAMIETFNNNPAFARVFIEAPFEITGKDALGSLMADAVCRVHGTDIAFQNNGGIRMGRLPKKITFKDVYTLDPFNNQVVEFTLSAEELRGLIRSSLGRHGSIDLQVAGMQYLVRVDADQQVKEIVLQDLGGRPLPESRSYKVGVSSYIASSYKFSHQDPGRALGSTTAEALIRFLESRPDLSVYQKIQRAFRDPPQTEEPD